MAWADLSNVTATLINLLQVNVSHLAGSAVNVVPTPPDSLGDGATKTLSIYLYHARETAATQNLPFPASDPAGIMTTPMGLDLHYVITAHQKRDDMFDALAEQTLLGYAVKTLHDYPLITDSTKVLGTKPMDSGEPGKGNRLSVEFRKMEPEQAFAIWTTGERKFTRLAAYFQVGLVMLQPEPARVSPGIVLSVGSTVTPMANTALTGTHSTLTYDLPPAAGNTPGSIRAQPARPFVVTAPGALSSLTIEGQGLAAGLERRLVLRCSRFQTLTPPLDRVVIDIGLNSPPSHPLAWSADFRDDRTELTLDSRLYYRDASGAVVPAPLTLYPGTYSVSLETLLAREVVAGQVRERRMRSNEVAFGYGPRLASASVQALQNEVTLQLDAPYTLVPAPPERPLDIQVAINGIAYIRNDTGPPLAGEFTPAMDSILVGASFDVTLPGLHSVGLVVEGIEAQPFWFTT